MFVAARVQVVGPGVPARGSCMAAQSECCPVPAWIMACSSLGKGATSDKGWRRHINWPSTALVLDDADHESTWTAGSGKPALQSQVSGCATMCAVQCAVDTSSNAWHARVRLLLHALSLCAGHRHGFRPHQRAHVHQQLPERARGGGERAHGRRRPQARAVQGLQAHQLAAGGA